MSKANRLAYATNLFQVLAPDGWRMLPDGLPQGGHAAICVVEHEDGREGVFRCLPDDADPKLVDRFNREIPILAEKIVHKNVVRLHAWSADKTCPWYISERGIPFREYWSGQKLAHQEDAEALLQSAIGVAHELADGLSVCHENGIVHRDVKIKNIVCKRGVDNPWPILIDFGIAHEADTERLTSLDDAVGNARFSPDVMRNRMNEVAPWVDIFELGQLFIWMLDVKAPKDHWPRPVHWQHVSFDPRLTVESETAIRAFIATCSVRTSAPQNGSEVSTLLNRLFRKNEPSAPTDEIAATIDAAQQRGIAKATLDNAAGESEIESCKPLGEFTYKQLRQSIERVVSSLRTTGSDISIRVDQPFSYDLHTARTLFHMHVGTFPQCVTFRIKCAVVTWSNIPQRQQYWLDFWRTHLPRNGNCFTFELASGVEAAHNTTVMDGRWVTIQSDGQIRLHPLDASFGRHTNDDIGGSAKGSGEITTIEEIEKYIASTCADGRFWEYIGAQSTL